ncbi:MAG: hypothetical protein HY537_04985 [Deltaproteobacteria bacterium]|nr:hypothetical protein [Deltaproteobacteria bacterium]
MTWKISSQIPNDKALVQLNIIFLAQRGALPMPSLIIPRSAMHAQK